MKINVEHEIENIDITELYFNLREKYEEVFIMNSCGKTFLYRQLGRKEYKELIENEDHNDYEKEEILCSVCTLYPENFDFGDCEAGIPTELSKIILKNSFLDSLESRQVLIDVHRKEMFEIDNQVSCLIHEAFPEFDLDEIEQWNLQKTAKYLSRSEWILSNLRGANFNHDPFTGKTIDEILAEEKDGQAAQSNNTKTDEVKTEFIAGETVEKRLERLKGGGPKEKMTPEKLRELKEKFPEMNWGNNIYDEISVNDFNESVSEESPALRPGF